MGMRRGGVGGGGGSGVAVLAAGDFGDFSFISEKEERRSWESVVGILDTFVSKSVGCMSVSLYAWSVKERNTARIVYCIPERNGK